MVPVLQAALRGYYGALLRTGLIRLGDRQSDRRFSSYNDPIGRFSPRLRRAGPIGPWRLPAPRGWR